jgi:hypothetical protein
MSGPNSLEPSDWIQGPQEPYLFHRKGDMSPKEYMFRAYVADGALQVGVWSISHEPEPVKIMVVI